MNSRKVLYVIKYIVMAMCLFVSVAMLDSEDLHAENVSVVNEYGQTPNTIFRIHKDITLEFNHADDKYAIYADSSVLQKLNLTDSITVYSDVNKGETTDDGSTIMNPDITDYGYRYTVYPVTSIDFSNIMSINQLYIAQFEDFMSRGSYKFYEWELTDASTSTYTKTDKQYKVIRIKSFEEYEKLHYIFHIEKAYSEPVTFDWIGNTTQTDMKNFDSSNNVPTRANYQFLGFKAVKDGNKSDQTYNFVSNGKTTLWINVNPQDLAEFIVQNAETGENELHFYPEFSEDFHLLLTRRNPITGEIDGEYDNKKVYMNFGSGNYTVGNKNFTGYVCTGWTDGTTTWPVGTTISPSDFPGQNEVSLTAVYERQVKLEFYDASDLTTPVYQTTFNPTTMPSITVTVADVTPARAGYEFTGWVASKTGRDDSALLGKTSNSQYTISYNTYRNYDDNGVIKFISYNEQMLQVAISYLVPGVANTNRKYYKKYEDFTLPTPEEYEGYRFLYWEDVTNGRGAGNDTFPAGRVLNRTTDYGRFAVKEFYGIWEQVTVTNISSFGRVYVNPRLCAFSSVTRFTVDSDPTVYNVQNFYVPSIGYYTFTAQ